MIKTKFDRIIISAVSIFLILLMILLLPVQRIAAAEEKQELYISEVRLGYGKNAEEAAKSLDGYTILKNGSKYADLNEGSGKSTVVLMGYKTTTEKSEAITDIAAMNMKGGYSFAEYEKWMEQYRDSHIMPFINRFMDTVKEYRANYNGTDKNNKAKAEYVREILNKYIDDDTGMGLGDVFLNTTAEELGLDKYNKLSDSEKKKYGCLSTILMQGKTTTIFQIEQVLTLASDTSDSTWLQRFSKMSADSLLKEYTDKGMGETDAKKALAREYEEGARIIADRWEAFRSSLLEYADTLKEEDGGIIPDDEDVDILSDKGSDEEEAEEDEEEAMTAEEANKILEGVDRDQLMVEMEMFSMYLDEIIAENAVESAGEVKTSFIYNYLKAMEYDGKTMYDYFTQSTDEIKKDNYFALYPLVASLTKGQTAGLELLSIEQLVAVGATDKNAYEKLLNEAKTILSKAETVSVFAGVNRELYSDKVALTDYSLRCSTAGIGTVDNTVSEISQRAILLTMGSLFLTIPMVQSINAAIKAIKDARSVETTVLKLSDRSKACLNALKERAKDLKRVTTKLDNIKNSSKIMEMINNVKTYPKGSREQMLALTYADDFEDYTQAFNEYSVKKLQISKNVYGTEVAMIDNNGGYKTVDFPSEVENVEGNNLDEVINNVETKATVREFRSVGSKWGAVLKTGLAVVFSLAFLGFTAYDIYVTAVDLYNYYHVDMTLVPKYIVERFDITYYDKDGNMVKYKNEEAYYQAIGSNRAKDHKYYETMQDYGDVNAAEGKQWLVLYTNKKTTDKTPILADSFKVVTGTTEMPEGYSTGIHMFGQGSPVNMTDVRFTYNNKLKDIYVYYKHAPVPSTSTGASGTNSSAAPATSSAFGTGNSIVMAVCGLVVGLAAGVFIMTVIRRKNESKAE